MLIQLSLRASARLSSRRYINVRFQPRRYENQLGYCAIGNSYRINWGKLTYSKRYRAKIFLIPSVTIIPNLFSEGFLLMGRGQFFQVLP